MVEETAVELILASVKELRSRRDNRKDLLDYFTALPKWPEPSAPGQFTGASETKNVTQSKVAMTCTTTNYDITSNPDTIVMLSPDLAALWPGAIIQGEGFTKGVGSVRELPIKKRSPIALVINLAATPSSITLGAPDAVSAKAGITKLIEPITTDFGTAVSFRQAETYSAEQAMISVGFSAKFTSGNFKAKHSNVTSSKKSVLTASFVQNCFTIFVPNPETPADLFSADYTLADLMEQERLGRIGPGNLPVLLSSVTYGRMLYVTISSSRSLEEVKNSLNASYNAGAGEGKGELSEQHKKVLVESEMTVTATGVEEKKARDLICSGKIGKFFSTPMSLISAWPLSYVFYNLGSMSIAGIADTAHYAITVCQERVAAQPTEALSRHMDSAQTNLREYKRFIAAAASNWSDARTRGVRMNQSRNCHTTFTDEIRWMTDSPLDDNDKLWLHQVWIPRAVAEEEEQAKSFKVGYDTNPSDDGTRAVYAEAVQYNGAHRVLLVALSQKMTPH